MNSINIIVQHGHIYNAESKERINLEEGVTYILVCEKEQNIKYFKPEERKIIRSEEEIYNHIKKDSKVTHIKKLFPAGTYLYFFINELNEYKEKGIEKGYRERV